jgi:hypothetical protein
LPAYHLHNTLSHHKIRQQIIAEAIPAAPLQ